MADEPLTPRSIKEPSYADAIIPAVTLIVLIAGAIFLFGLDALDGPVQVALIFCDILVALIITKNGHSWDDVAKSAQAAMGSVTTPFFILFGIGALIGTWNMSGTIPTMVYYGIHLLHPAYFYVATLVICTVISLGIGSSWTTAGTIGVGLVGLATMVGVSPAITAGAVVSGSYVGDKISPLSETTVLTAQLAKVDVFTHIRAMLWTTVPSFLIAAVGVHVSQPAGRHPRPQRRHWERTLQAESALLDYAVEPDPAACSAGTLVSQSTGLACNPQLGIAREALWRRFCNRKSFYTLSAIQRFLPRSLYVKGIWLAMATGYHVNTGIKEVDSLLSRGGMASMLKTLWIIIGAVTFGTLLEEFNLLAKLINPILERAKTTGGLIAAVVGTALGLNIIAADQYIALVLPVRLYRTEFEKRGLKAQNLSRACADAGTVTSPLVPWNSCGAYMAAALGVATMAYLPFAIFNITAPIMSLLLGFTGFKIQHIQPAEAQADIAPTP